MTHNRIIIDWMEHQCCIVSLSLSLTFSLLTTSPPNRIVSNCKSPFVSSKRLNRKSRSWIKGLLFIRPSLNTYNEHTHITEWLVLITTLKGVYVGMKVENPLGNFVYSTHRPKKEKEWKVKTPTANVTNTWAHNWPICFDVCARTGPNLIRTYFNWSLEYTTIFCVTLSGTNVRTRTHRINNCVHTQNRVPFK